MARRSAALSVGLLLIALSGCSGDDSPDDAAAEPASSSTESPDTAPSATAAPASPSTTVTPTITDPFADWCALAVRIEEVDLLGDELDPADPAALEEYFTSFLPLLDRAVVIAPDEIADAVRTSAEIADEANEALAAVDYDLLTVDLSAVAVRDEQNDLATDAIEAFNEAQCGIPRDDDETDVDDVLPLERGSLRDQFVASLVAAGFAEDEATCIFGEIDFSSAPSLEDPAVMTAIFDACGISLARLAEIESVVPTGGAADPGDEAFVEVFVDALVVQGFTEDEAACIAEELGTDGTPVDDEVIAAMDTCGIGASRIAELMGG